MRYLLAGAGLWLAGRVTAGLLSLSGHPAGSALASCGFGLAIGLLAACGWQRRARRRPAASRCPPGPGPGWRP